MMLVLNGQAQAELARTLAAGMQARVAAGETVSRDVSELLRSLHAATQGQSQATSGHTGGPGGGRGHDAAMDLRSAARLLGVSERTVRRRVADGWLPAHRVGRRLVFERDELDRYRRQEGAL